MDSAYMGDTMAQIGHHEWKVNMVGTAQMNRTGADVKTIKNGMKKGTYESVMFQHNTEPLVYAMWYVYVIVIDCCIVLYLLNSYILLFCMGLIII